jgi:4-hydroxy-tetrahydrodipicolinate synthase
VAAARAQQWDAAWRIYTHYLPLIVFEQQPGLAIRKEICRMRGWITSNRVRHPGATIDPETKKQLEQVIRVTVGDADLTKPIPVEGL